MKLRNKKTGEIRELPDGFFCGDNLKKICEEWEDYEEPKERYYIDSQNDCVSEMFMPDRPTWDFNKSIGNYFETKEEAERTVEKLKAVKRLKDKGFSIYSWDYEFDMVDKPAQTIILRASAVDSSNEDLDLLFGGEE